MRWSLRPSPVLCLVVLGGLLGLSLSGCENTIEPYAERAETYSIQGYLSETRQNQFIRVKRLDAPFAGERARSVEATVQLKNLTDGTQETLRDSVIVFEDEGREIVTHNFWTDTPIQPETEYRLVVEAPEGERTTATATTPASTQAQAAPDSADCLSGFTVAFPPIQDDRLVRADVEFEYRVGGSDKTTTLAYSQQDGLREREDGSVFFRFEPEDLLLNTYEPVNDESEECYYTPLCVNLASAHVTIRYTYLGPDWEGTVPEEDPTLDPTESPYINNGKGFFGALRRDTTTVEVDTTEIYLEDKLQCPARSENSRSASHSGSEELRVGEPVETGSAQ